MYNLPRAAKVFGISFIVLIILLILNDKRLVSENAKVLSMKVFDLNEWRDVHFTSTEKLTLAPGLKTVESMKTKKTKTRSKHVKYKSSRFREILQYNTTQLRQLVDIHMQQEKLCDFQRYDERKKEEKCSFKSVKKYIDECGYFPRHITWKEDTPVTLGYCKLPDDVRWIQVHQYLHRHVTNIITTGDSQGYRYSNAFINAIRRSGIKCRLIKSESVGFTVSSAYFQRPEDSAHKAALKDPTRTCRSCTSFQQKWYHLCRVLIAVNSLHSNTSPSSCPIT